QHHVLLALPHDATGDLGAESAKIVQANVGGIFWPVHPLDRQTKSIQVPITGDVYRLKVAEEGRPLIPGHVFRKINDVISEERAQGGKLDSFDVEARQESLELIANFQKMSLPPVDAASIVD